MILNMGQLLSIPFILSGIGLIAWKRILYIIVDGTASSQLKTHRNGW